MPWVAAYYGYQEYCLSVDLCVSAWYGVVTPELSRHVQVNTQIVFLIFIVSSQPIDLLPPPESRLEWKWEYDMPSWCIMHLGLRPPAILEPLRKLVIYNLCVCVQYLLLYG
jgi:hypothetical protein